MPVVFNSVKTYVETVGRRRSIRHANEIDSLECMFTGPTPTVDQWIPQLGAPHPDYPTMRFDGAEAVNEAAGITTLRTTYIGKYYANTVFAGSATHWGEISYSGYWGYKYILTEPAIEPLFTPGTNTLVNSPRGAILQLQVISNTFACRYCIETATYRGLIYGSDISAFDTHSTWESGRGSVLSQRYWTTARSVSSNGYGLVSSSLSFEPDLIDQSVNPLNNGWYEVSQTYGPQPVVVSSAFSLTLPETYQESITVF